MKAILLAGGLGTRMREETEFRPKPMVEVGGKPVLWHIMKGFATFGVTDFVVCLGYKGDVIKDYFLDYEARNNDFTITLGRSREITFHDQHLESDWRVTVAETGAFSDHSDSRGQHLGRGEADAESECCDVEQANVQAGAHHPDDDIACSLGVPLARQQRADLRGRGPPGARINRHADRMCDRTRSFSAPSGIPADRCDGSSVRTSASDTRGVTSG